MLVNKIANEFSSSLMYIHVIYHSVVTLVMRLVIIEMAFIFNGPKTGLPVHVAQLWVSCTHPVTD